VEVRRFIKARLCRRGYQWNIDPMLLGIKRGIPSIFKLGRWSASGLFPKMYDLIGDTMDHLEQYLHLLKNIPPSTPWVAKGHQFGQYGDLQNKYGDENTVLVPFAQQVLAAWENKEILPFLRSELGQIAA